MIFNQLEANMLSDLGRPNSNSVMNELKSLGIKFPKARPGFSKLFNQFSELSRQAREGEIMRPQANKQIRDLLIPAASDFVNWAVNGDPEETPGYESPSNDNLNPDQEMTKGSELLRKFDPEKSDLKSALLLNHHVLSYAPIVPLCKPFLLADKLSEKGFKFSNLNGYIILERQLVVGADNHWMKEKVGEFKEVAKAFDDLRSLGVATKNAPVATGEFAAACVALRAEAINVLSQMKSNDDAQNLLAEIKSQKPARDLEHANNVTVIAHKICTLLKQQMDSWSGPTDDKSLIESLTKAASKSLKKNYSVFGSPINHLGATWVWLMTQKEINLLQSCALGGHFSLVRWGLAFANESV